MDIFDDLSGITSDIHDQNPYHPATRGRLSVSRGRVFGMNRWRTTSTVGFVVRWHWKIRKVSSDQIIRPWKPSSQNCRCGLIAVLPINTPRFVQLLLLYFQGLGSESPINRRGQQCQRGRYISVPVEHASACTRSAAPIVLAASGLIAIRCPDLGSTGEEVATKRGVFIGSTAIKPHRQFWLEGFHGRHDLVRRKPFESSNATERQIRPWKLFSNGFIPKTRPRETDNRPRVAGW